nr:CotH kinase family protein [Maliibacterium massiliense]
MITKRYVCWIVLCAMLCAVLLCVGMMAWPDALGQASGGVHYAEKLFDKTRISTIDIRVDADAWQEMLDAATQENYIACDLVVNGETFANVGIRPKGNTSLSQVAASESDRYSFKVEMDHYDSGMSYYGLDKFVLNNIHADTTYMKEYLAYDLMDFIGVTSPLCAYTSITVNGEAWGCYLAIEALEESFALRNYGQGYGALYKVEGDRGGRGMGASGGGGDLRYNGDEASSYSDIFSGATFEADEASQERVIQAISQLNAGGDLERYVDVDQALRYFAANTVLVNLDSYVSSLKHNYYLYEKDGCISILPWDFNLAFGGFQAGSASSAVNFPIDTPCASNIDLADRPLLGKLLEVADYAARYHAYLQEIVTDYFNSGRFEAAIDAADALIAPYVQQDATAFVTYEQYKASLPVLKIFGLLRAQSIQGQLDGTIPATSQGQAADASALVDASSINLSDLGSQGGGAQMAPGGGRGAAQGEMPDMPQGEMPDIPQGEMPDVTQDDASDGARGTMPDMPRGASPDALGGDGAGRARQADAQDAFIPGQGQMRGNTPQHTQQDGGQSVGAGTWWLVGLSGAALLVGIALVACFRRHG